MGSVVAVHGLSCPHNIWDPPRAGIEAMSPALTGRFWATGPPGKSLCSLSWKGRDKQVLETTPLLEWPLLLEELGGLKATWKGSHLTTWFNVCSAPPYQPFLGSWADITSPSTLVSYTSEVKSCPTLCNPMHCSLPCSSVHGIFQARVLEWVAISFSRQRIFPTQESNPGLPHCRQTLYHLSHQEVLHLCLLAIRELQPASGPAQGAS